MFSLGITVHPTISEPKSVEEEKKRRQSKYRFPWRINMLAKPNPRKKYVTPCVSTPKVFPPVEPATLFRAEHLSMPNLRKLYDNKKLYDPCLPKVVKRLDKVIGVTWHSIYNYYRKKLRDRRRLQLRRKRERDNAKKPKGKELEKIEAAKHEHLEKLATPKKVRKPKKKPHKWRPIEQLLPYLLDLAAPTQHPLPPPLELGKVSPAALRYTPTENILKMALPLAFKRWQPPEPDGLGRVTKAALRFKCTPLLEKLAMPSLSRREARKQEEDKYDPWVISRNALKYKATPRILELAQPIDRD